MPTIDLASVAGSGLDRPTLTVAILALVGGAWLLILAWGVLHDGGDGDK
jgi:hypothetical protein